MAKYVSEIINPELFSLPPGATLGEARSKIIALGITAAPILNEDGRPVGIISLRDLLGGDDDSPVARRMGGPVVVIEEDATVDDAAYKLAEEGLHRLVVIDASGKATGVVSLIDVVRAMLSLPKRFSDAFPHLDKETGLVWTDDEMLSFEHVAHAATGPGIIVISYGSRGEVDTPILIDSCHSIRTRLKRALEWPRGEGELFAEWVEERGDRLRFRVSVVDDKSAREQLVRQLRADVREKRK